MHTQRPLVYCLPETSMSIPYDLAWLLLTAPKERRLDLALASIMYSWEVQLAEAILDGKGVLVPIWSFNQKGSFPSFTYTPQRELPGIDQMLSNPVPFYSLSTVIHQFRGANHQLRHWLDEQNVAYTLTYEDPLCVQLKCNDGNDVTVKESEGLTLPTREVRMAALLALATVHLCAPDLVPYLEIDIVFPAPDLTESARQESTHPLYQVHLIPCQTPIHADRDCMYQEWNPYTGRFVSCASLKRKQSSLDEEEEYAPDQCPCCGSFYCDVHFSDVRQEFVLTMEEVSRYQVLKGKLRLCRNCALLEESVRLTVRSAFLQANGKSPFDPIAAQRQRL